MTILTATELSVLVEELLPVAILADLRELAAPDNQASISVQGGTAAGDGDGGDFWYDSASTAADDGDLVIKPDSIAASAAGRWRRIQLDSVVEPLSITNAHVSTTAAIALSKLAAQATYTVVANNTAGSAVPTAVGYATLGISRPFDTVALMTAATPRYDGESVSVLGYTTKGDGGGGTFYWSAASSATANGGTVFAADAGGVGRWLRPDTGVVTAKGFGATGDGATDDFAALQAALTWAVANNQMLFLEEGTYLISAQLACTAGTFCIYGAGRRVSIIKASGATGMLKHTRASALSGSILLRDFGLHGNDVATSGLILQDCNYSEASNVEVRNVNGKALWLSNVEDVSFSGLDTRHSGRINVDSGTAQAGAAGTLTLQSGASAVDNFYQYMIAEITGGTGSGQFRFISSYVGSTKVATLSADWTVTPDNTSVYRIGEPGVLINDVGIQQTAICNSLSFDNQCTFERHKYTGIFIYRAEGVKFQGPKLHGRTTSDDVTPDDIDLCYADRISRVAFLNPQIAHVRRYGFLLDRSGGSQNIGVSILGGHFDSAAAYTGTALANIRAIRGLHVVNGNHFHDALGHASYGSNGYDIRLEANCVGVQGANNHYGSPLAKVSSAVSGKHFAPLALANTAGTYETPPTNARVQAFWEEGTFTPVVVGTSAAGTGTYTTQTGRFTRVGNRVLFNLYVVWTAHDGTGNLTISGLPYTSANQTLVRQSVAITSSNLTFGGQLTGYIGPGTTTITLSEQSTGAAIASVAMDAAATLWISGQYETAAA